jgi:hypothetical protein
MFVTRIQARWIRFQDTFQQKPEEQKMKEVRFVSLKLVALAAAALAISPTNIFATALPITDSGILTIANLGGTLVGVTSSPTTCINWAGGSTCVANTQHQYSVSGVSNLFSTTASANDLIKDLPSLPPPTLTDFLQVQGAGAIVGSIAMFDLTSVPLTAGGAGFGNCLSNAANNSCSPPGSPFTFQESSTGTDVTVSFSTQLLAYTGTSASGTTAYTGTFSTDQALVLNGSGACNGLAANITNILSCEAAGGTIAATWSATLAPSATPEPISFILFGSGLIGVAVFGRRFRRS